MRTDYLGLEAFVAIAELGSFNRAAAYLNLTQTALSHRIRKIEADLGVQLLIRSTRDVLLTKEGQALLPQVQRNLAHLSEAYDGLRKRGQSKQERLAFACLPTIANYYLPSILRQFSAECPGIAIQLHDQPFGRVYELVQAGEVEFGISIIGPSIGIWISARSSPNLMWSWSGATIRSPGRKPSPAPIWPGNPSFASIPSRATGSSCTTRSRSTAMQSSGVMRCRTPPWR